jgi:hypothetical protein
VILMADKETTTTIRSLDFILQDNNEGGDGRACNYSQNDDEGGDDGNGE